MQQSFFGYNITRRYPYRWFTWLVVIGGIISASLLTAVNLAANGYELSITTTTDPNSTEHSSSRWFQKKPWSQAAKVVSSNCQYQTLAVGSQFYTNNFGFSYVILSLNTLASAPRASCSYHNDHLHDCRLYYLSLSAGDGGLSNRTSIDAYANLNCTLYDDSDAINMTLGMSAQISGASINSYVASSKEEANLPLFRLLGEKSGDSSLFWDHSVVQVNPPFSVSKLSDLLRGSLFQALEDFGQKSFQEYFYEPHSRNPYYNLATARFVGYPSIALDRYSDRFPNSPTAEAFLSTLGIDILSLPWRIYKVDSPFKMMNGSNPYIYTTSIADSIAKSLHFLILADLGQNPDMNVLASPQKTMEFFFKTMQLIQVIGGLNTKQVLNFFPILKSTTSWPPNTLNEFYAWAGSTLPRVDPTTISMQYLCQVPKLKSIGSVIVSVVTADLVFLHLLWNVLQLVMSYIVERKDPQATYCVGCAANISDPGSAQAEPSINDQRAGFDDVAYTSALVLSKNHDPYRRLPEATSQTQSSIDSPAISFLNETPANTSNEDERTVEPVRRAGRTTSEAHDVLLPSARERGYL